MSGPTISDDPRLWQPCGACMGTGNYEHRDAFGWDSIAACTRCDRGRVRRRCSHCYARPADTVTEDGDAACFGCAADLAAAEIAIAAEHDRAGRTCRNSIPLARVRHGQLRADPHFWADATPWSEWGLLAKPCPVCGSHVNVPEVRS